MDSKLKELKEEYKAWLVVAYKEVQENGVTTTDYLVFADKNYFVTDNRVEDLDISIFKTFLDKQVLSQLNGDKKEKLSNIIKDVKQYLNRSV